jgi:hypothetical protein
MKAHLVYVALAVSAAATAAEPTGIPLLALPEGPPAIVMERTHRGGGIGYLFAGNVTVDDPTAPPWTELAVGAQLNGHANTGSNQIVFGIATEAWAAPGSFSILTGIEATPVNMEPDNPFRKIAFFATYKTRPDGRWDDVPAEPGNLDSQALRLESQPGTGFERGIVLAQNSLHASRKEPRPILIDLREVPPETLATWDLFAFPDGCRLRYAGQGRLDVSC